MRVHVNGVEREVRDGTLLDDLLKDNDAYIPGSVVSIVISDEKLRQTTDDFEIHTIHGSMTLHLEDNANAKIFREKISLLIGNNMRWKTSNVLAFGSIGTEIKGDRGEYM